MWRPVTVNGDRCTSVQWRSARLFSYSTHGESVEIFWRRDLTRQQSRVGSPPSHRSGGRPSSRRFGETILARIGSEDWRRERDSNPNNAFL